MPVDSIRTLEEHSERMNKADTEVIPPEKKGLSDKLITWFNKNIARTRDHSEGVEDSQDVAKRKKVDRVIRSLVSTIQYETSLKDPELVKKIKSLHELEEIQSERGISNLIQSEDLRILNVREHTGGKQYNPTISEQLTREEKTLAEKVLYRKVQERIIKVLVRTGNAYLSSVQERSKRGFNWNDLDHANQKRDLVYFVQTTDLPVRVKESDREFVQLEDQVFKALRARKNEIASNSFDYLHIFNDDASVSDHELPKAA